MSELYEPPAAVEISDFDPKKLQFLINSPLNQRAVEKQLEAVYGKPIWPKKSTSNSLTIECTLIPGTINFRKLARTWKTKVKENLDEYLDLLHVCKHTTLQEAIPLVLNELTSLTISNPDAVAVVLEKSNHEIYVTGHRQAVTDLSKQVSDIILGINAEHRFIQGPDVSGVSDMAMSQHYVDCQTCGDYSDFYCNACHKRMCGNCRDEHLKHPDNAKHDVCRYEDRKFVFSSVPCKAHPKHQMVLCCKKCQQAICALCTTKEHEGHGFLDLEEVYTKKYKTRTEEIRRIRDEFLLNSRLRLKESRNATLELKGNLELMRNSMKEQASQIKGLVDAILTENLHDLQGYEASAVEKLEKQEKVLDAYVTHVHDTCVFEEYKNSMFFGNPVEFLSGINDTLDVKFEPIPDVQKLSPGNFSEGKLNKEEIRKQFGALTKPSNEA